MTPWVRQKLEKNAAVLRNLTDLKQIMHSGTRWSAKLYMLRRFLNIREELLQIHDSLERDIEIDDTTRFQGKVIKYRKNAAHQLYCNEVVKKQVPYIIWM